MPWFGFFDWVRRSSDVVTLVPNRADKRRRRGSKKASGRRR
jgi:hypothetical protein